VRGAAVEPLLSIKGLTKVFPGQVALDDVHVELTAGRTRALVGQNGSGKSTLIKVLAGYHQPTSVQSAVMSTADGQRPLALGDSNAAHEAGIRFVHQDLALVDTLSTVENIALGSGYLTRRGHIDWKGEAERARADLRDLGFPNFPVTALVGTLEPSQRTAVALARAMRGWQDGASLLVLDEPTASLPHDEVERLFEAVRRLKERGVAILYVSHHLDEVFEIADEVTVLRDGRVVATLTIGDLDRGRLIELLIGHRLESRQPAAARAGRGDALLMARGLHGGTVRALDLTVHAGEVVGVAGITGSGREHVVPLIIGQVPSVGGEVMVAEQPIDPYAPDQLLAAGGAFVTADRARLGNFATMSVVANTTICDVGRNAERGRLVHRRERAEVDLWIQKLETKTTGGAATMSTLSGGNQQKVLFARGLRLEPRVIVLDEPTCGIDVGAKEEIHTIIDRAAADGAAVLVASTDTDELVRLSDRVLVMRRGTVVAEFTGDRITSHDIEHAQLATNGDLTRVGGP